MATVARRPPVDPNRVRVRYIAECRRGERGAKTRTAAAFGITPARVGQIVRGHTPVKPPVPPAVSFSYVTQPAATFVLPKDDPFTLSFGLRIEGEPTEADILHNARRAHAWLVCVRALFLAGCVLIPVASALGVSVGDCCIAIGAWLVLLLVGREVAAG